MEAEVVIDAVKVYSWQPGDRLVVRSRDAMPLKDFLILRDTLAAWAPPDVPVVILAPGMELEVVRPPKPQG